MSGKVGQNGEYEEIARGIYGEEYEQALALARDLDLRIDPRSVGERRRLAHARRVAAGRSAANAVAATTADLAVQIAGIPLSSS